MVDRETRTIEFAQHVRFSHISSTVVSFLLILICIAGPDQNIKNAIEELELLRKLHDEAPRGEDWVQQIAHMYASKQGTNYQFNRPIDIDPHVIVLHDNFEPFRYCLAVHIIPTPIKDIQYVIDRDALAAVFDGKIPEKRFSELALQEVALAWNYADKLRLVKPYGLASKFTAKVSFPNLLSDASSTSHESINDDAGPRVRRIDVLLGTARRFVIWIHDEIPGWFGVGDTIPKRIEVMTLNQSTTSVSSEIDIKGVNPVLVPMIRSGGDEQKWTKCPFQTSVQVNFAREKTALRGAVVKLRIPQDEIAVRQTSRNGQRLSFLKAFLGTYLPDQSGEYPLPYRDRLKLGMLEISISLAVVREAFGRQELVELMGPSNQLNSDKKFHEAFPYFGKFLDEFKYWKLKNVHKEVRQNLVNRFKTVKVSDVDIPVASFFTFGPAISLAVQVYFLIHLLSFARKLHYGKLNRSALSMAPWVGLYTPRWPRFIFFVTLLIPPFLGVVVAMESTHYFSQAGVMWGGIALTVVSTILALLIYRGSSRLRAMAETAQ